MSLTMLVATATVGMIDAPPGVESVGVVPPTVYHWVAIILGVVVPAAVLVDRVLLHPAQIIYDQSQNGHENRSPNYRETMENQRRIDALHDRLDAAAIPTAGGENDST